MRILFFICCLILTASGKGQTVNLSDSLRDILRYPPKFMAKIGTQNSFITGSEAQIYNVKAGVRFRKSLSIGIGYNWLKTVIYEPVSRAGQIDLWRIQLLYIAPFAEYTFFRKGPWEATVPVQIGVGKSFLEKNEKGAKLKQSAQAIVLYEPAMTVEYKFFRFIGLGAGVGYRIMLKNNRDIHQQFTSTEYVLRLRLIFSELYQYVRDEYNNREKAE